MIVIIWNNKGEEIVLVYGDNFKEIIVNSDEVKNVECISQEYNYTVVYYIDKSCGSCINSLYMIEQMCKIFQHSDVNNIILWQGEIGKKHLEKTSIPVKANFCIEGAYINTATPTYYIVEKTGKILFVGNQIKDVLDKLQQLDALPSQEDIIHYYKDYAQQIFPNDKPILVYFSMVGCKDCEAIEPVVNSQFVRENYNIITLYRDRGNVPDEMRSQVDYGGLLAKVFNIDWYPSFLILGDQNNMVKIGEMSVDEIKTILHNQTGGKIDES